MVIKAEPGRNARLREKRTGEIHEAIVDDSGVVRNEDGESFSEGAYVLTELWVP